MAEELKELAEELQEFGTDGKRGVVDPSGGPGQINAEMVERLSQAFAERVYEQGGAGGLFITGRDTRESGPELLEATCRGLASRGGEVWNLDIAPTPVIAWLAKKYGAYGVSLTASHNPPKYNGYKPFEIGGVKPPVDVLRQIEQLYRESLRKPVTAGGGKIISRPGLINDYLKSMTETFGGSGVLDGKTVIIDGANGAAYDLAPRLYRALGATVIEFACTSDGARINEGCGAAHLEGVTAFLAAHKDLARSSGLLGVLAKDGDGDRVMGVDARGRVVDGNYWLRRMAVGEVGIVGTVYTNSALRMAVGKMGVKFHECANGDSNVTAMLQALSLKKGGEFTGHLIDLDHLSSGDGLYMGAWLATRLAAEGATLTDLRDEMELWPERMVNINVGTNDANVLLERPSVQEAIKEVKEELGNAGRAIVRASGTEPLIRIYVEAEASETLEGTIAKLVNILR